MTTQNHLHLDTVIGGSPENAPTRTWKTIDREEIPVVFMNVRYTLRATPRLHVAKLFGTPVQKTDFEYIFKIAATETETVAQQKAALRNLNGRRCYLVDHEHPDDGVDHAAYRREVDIRVGSFKRDVADLHFYYVPVSVTDLS